MGDVIDFPGDTVAPLDANKVASWAGDLQESVVVGFLNNGELYVAGSSADPARVIYLLELGKKHMLERSK